MQLLLLLGCGRLATPASVKVAHGYAGSVGEGSVTSNPRLQGELCPVRLLCICAASLYYCTAASSLGTLEQACNTKCALITFIAKLQWSVGEGSVTSNPRLQGELCPVRLLCICAASLYYCTAASSLGTLEQACNTKCAIITFIAKLQFLGISPPTKRHSLNYKISKIVRSCLYFLLSCLFFHTVVVLYGAPLLESAVETFSLGVLLSTMTTLRCLCMMGPNVQAWIRVFSRDGAMSVWDTSLQITTGCSVLGAWLGAFPIPLDWDRPWQVWPVSCTLGATVGFLTGLLVAPVWIHWHRKQLIYKSK
ncbi:phosphatidylinositol-glycan biosynthesis class F protein [Clupea harengus]|uniref:Phosphatidylinositol-glycan biosynthesis class F protein n=1 Tax=Clupea harengus TaxID=7950 RepID=A0A6P8GND5_CLUHA|nr:phosphatidylinositol-glycan biosynthesis class F protein [Clupea harengus]